MVHPSPTEDTFLADADPAKRQEAARIWAMRAGLELSVSAAYAVILRELFQTGAERPVLELCSAACAEEVRHAVLCLEVAEALDGKQRHWPTAASLHVPSYDGVAPGPMLSALHLVAMSCLNESIACVRLAEALKLTRVDVVKDALHQILRDEVQHARAGWAHLAGQHVTVEMKAAIGRFVPHLISASLRGLIEENDSIPSEHFAAFGLPHLDLAREHAQKAVFDVVLPGFVRLGIPFDHARARVSVLSV